MQYCFLSAKFLEGNCGSSNPHITLKSKATEWPEEQKDQSYSLISIGHSQGKVKTTIKTVKSHVRNEGMLQTGYVIPEYLSKTLTNPQIMS